MQSNLMRMRDPKVLAHNIERMKWSNKMDLIAMSTDKGELIVQRLTLQTLWVHPAPYENARVCGFDWRPDVHILAVGYDSGKIILIDVEDHQILYTQELGTEITHLSWTQNTEDSYDDLEELQGQTKLFADGHRYYLPLLPNFSALTSNVRKADFNHHKMYDSHVFNVLMAGTRAGTVQLFVFGMLASGQINVRYSIGALPNEGLDICDVRMSPDFGTTFVWIKYEGRFRQLAFDNPIYANAETVVALLKLSTRYGHIVNTMTYVDEIVQCIIEAWETAKLEMERKLTKYVNARPPGVVSADFLDLLLFGYAPDPLTEFLTRDLTAKGMKRLEHSIEITYATIQKLVVRPLHTAILNISFHLNYLKGMSKNTYLYRDIIGKISNEASLNAGSLLIKAFELQQVIEQSRRDYKIFWNWLYNIIVFLTTMGDPATDEIGAISQQDVIFLSEFLNTFDDCCEVDTDDRRHIKFNLERVGQYLDNQNLQKQSRLSLSSDWKKLLAQNECLQNSGSIYEHHKEMSLIQEHSHLRDSINRVFEKPNALISLKFEMHYCFDICEISDTADIIWHNCEAYEANTTFFTAAIDRKTVYFMEMTPYSEHTKMTKLSLEGYPDIERMSLDEGGQQSTSRIVPSPQRQFPGMELVHFQFYNEKTLCMLFRYKREHFWSNCFVQLPVDALRAQSRSMPLRSRVNVDRELRCIPFGNLLDVDNMRALEIHDGCQIAVSGGRKIATILTGSRKNIYHYETEVEEDDEPEDDDFMEGEEDYVRQAQDTESLFFDDESMQEAPNERQRTDRESPPPPPPMNAADDESMSPIFMERPEMPRFIPISPEPATGALPFGAPETPANASGSGAMRRTGSTRPTHLRLSSDSAFRLQVSPSLDGSLSVPFAMVPPVSPTGSDDRPAIGEMKRISPMRPIDLSPRISPQSPANRLTPVPVTSPIPFAVVSPCQSPVPVAGRPPSLAYQTSAMLRSSSPRPIFFPSSSSDGDQEMGVPQTRPAAISPVASAQRQRHRPQSPQPGPSGIKTYGPPRLVSPRTGSSEMHCSRSPQKQPRADSPWPGPSGVKPLNLSLKQQRVDSPQPGPSGVGRVRLDSDQSTSSESPDTKRPKPEPDDAPIVIQLPVDHLRLGRCEGTVNEQTFVQIMSVENFLASLSPAFIYPGRRYVVDSVTPVDDLLADRRVQFVVVIDNEDEYSASLLPPQQTNAPDLLCIEPRNAAVPPLAIAILRPDAECEPGAKLLRQPKVHVAQPYSHRRDERTGQGLGGLGRNCLAIKLVDPRAIQLPRADAGMLQRMGDQIRNLFQMDATARQATVERFIAASGGGDGAGQQRPADEDRGSGNDEGREMGVLGPADGEEERMQQE